MNNDSLNSSKIAYVMRFYYYCYWLALCLVFPSIANAQEFFSYLPDSNYTPKAGIYFQPLDLVTGSLRMGFEQRIAPNMGLLFLCSYARKDNSSIYKIEDYSRATFEAQYRFYTSGVAFTGIYLGPYLYYRHIGFAFRAREPRTNTWPFIRGEGHAIGLGYMFGLQYLAHKRVTIDAYFGGGMKWAFFSGEAQPYINQETELRTNLWDEYRNAIRINLGISLGFLLY